MSTTLMKCGHTASGRDSLNKPVCVICIGINPGAEEVVVAKPDLKGRIALCHYCKTEKPSNYDLPFFESGVKVRWNVGKPPVRDMSKDTFYCGCRGWD